MSQYFCRLMRAHLVILAATLGLASQSAAQNDELARWEQQARAVTISRDDWGIAHVSGKTDADAVFGMIYAQAEDDFNRVETNYLNSLGRLAEAEGETAIWSDLRQKLFIKPESLKNSYDVSPTYLKKLMNAWADGLNFYLARNPTVKPRVIKRFEPWMALSFTEGSIGGDIETISLAGLSTFYGGDAQAGRVNDDVDTLAEPTGSNGFAIAPSNTKNGRALLLINPHTSFFFRSELQMTSEEGLNAYGAVTWGQFFVYQGFNERLGWMHTSSAVDAIDHYLETITKKGAQYFYKHGAREQLVTKTIIKIPYKTARGMAERNFSTYRTHHGPVISSENGKWMTINLMYSPVNALMQSFERTKARNYKEFRQVMELKGNSSNNTIYADADGKIAYFHVNYVPRRDPKFDWTKPVDGSDPATDYRNVDGSAALTYAADGSDPTTNYKDLHEIDELPNLVDPATGWLYNTNNYPWSAAGPSSLKQVDYPAYIDSGTENVRGRHAIRVLENRKDFTLDSLIAAAYDSYLPWFEKPIPALVKAWDAAPASSPLKAKLAEQIKILRAWDMRWSVGSVPTSLAVFWGEDIVRKSSADARRSGLSAEEYIAKVAADQLLQSLAAASERLVADFGTWKTPWGDINRFQRLTGDIVHPFSDAAPSIPVGFTSGNWGSLASFGARPYKGSKKWYGTGGNSFVAVVEFGKTVRAKAVTAGGESGNPKSKHFNDQAKRYSTGDLREVYFYPSQLKGRTERAYSPGK